MIVTKKFSFDLETRGISPLMYAVQGEVNTRKVEISLFSNGTAWEIPDGTVVAVAYRKPDGTGGLYDKLPSGESASAVSGNVVTVMLAPQVLTCAGNVVASIVFYSQDMVDTLATFSFQIHVEKNPGAGQQISNNYYTLQNLEQVNTAYNDLLERVLALEQGGGSGQNGDGLTSEVKTALMAVVENIGLWANGDGKTLIDNLRTALYSAPIASITAVYTQTKTVYASDSLDVLRDDLIVTATYTDGTSSVLTDYALSGSLRVGTSTVTVSKNGKSTTFTVTVTAARVPATGITLDKTTLSLASSASVKLTATVTPDNATDTVVWASSEEAVAKVSSDGTVTPVADGSCVISATAGDFTAECAVKVALPLNGLNIGNPYLMNVNGMPSSVATTEEEAQGKWYRAVFTAWTSKLGIERTFFLHPFTNGTFYIRMLGRTLSDPIEFYAFGNADIGLNPTATLGKVGGEYTNATVTKFTTFDSEYSDSMGRVDLGEWTYVDNSETTCTNSFVAIYKVVVPENVYVFMTTAEMSASRFPGISETFPDMNKMYTIFDSDPSANILQIVE